MKRLLLSSILVFSFAPAFAAQNNNHWYKVEPKKIEKRKPKKQSYQYDSLEKGVKKQTISKQNYWSIRPKFSLGGGFLADKQFIKGGSDQRYFLSSHINFRNRVWHRLSVGGFLLQNNSFLIDTSWHYLPSRKKIRPYYGIGLSHSTYTDKAFLSIFDLNNYFITGSYGIEMLFNQSQGIRGEIKFYWGANNYSIRLLVSYIWSL